LSNVIELSSVGWKAGKSFALDDVSLNVPAGSIYGFLGPNGSGKTTTIRLFMGMLRPDHGTISIFGRSVPKDMKSILARNGYEPERPHEYPALTVAEQVRFHSSFFRLTPELQRTPAPCLTCLPLHRDYSSLAWIQPHGHCFPFRRQDSWYTT
jgi:ABC-2 type transport system ATP-binding protein